MSEEHISRYDMITVDDLNKLKEFKCDSAPVLSLYLDVTPPERANKKHITKFKRLVREARERMSNASREYLSAFQEEAGRLQRWLEVGYDETGRGLAVFSCSAEGLWEAFRLPAPLRDRLAVDDRPYIRPLVTLADEYERYAVLLIDKKMARMFLVYMGEIAEYSEVIGKDVSRPTTIQQSRPSGRKDRGAKPGTDETYLVQHVKRVISALEEFYPNQECDRLIIGGTDEAISELRNRLPKSLARQLVAEISISLKAHPDEVLRRTLEIEQQIEREVEAGRLSMLLRAAGEGKGGILGLEPTLRAIFQGRVRMLIVEEGYRKPGLECPNCSYLTTAEATHCPACETPLEAIPDVVERAIEAALDQKAQIEVLRGETKAEMAEQGHIGALLRY